MPKRRANGKGTVFKTGTSPNYQIRWTDQNGIRRQQSTGTSNKSLALRYLNKVVDEVRQYKLGFKDDIEEKIKMNQMKPLIDHLRDFKKAHEAKGVTDKQVHQVNYRIKRLLRLCKFKYWKDIRPSIITTKLAVLRQPHTCAGRKVKGLTIQSSNFYLRAIKQFAKWMLEEQRVKFNPIAHLKMMNPNIDPRKRKRMTLNPEELQRLIRTAVNGPFFKKTSGLDRAIIYQLAVETGLRSNELRSLTKHSFKLDASPPSIHVQAAFSKRRKDDSLPLKTDTSNMLKNCLNFDRSEDKVFNMPDSWDMAKMIRFDAKRAGIPITNEQNEVLDFHSLRHTFITNLARSNVHPKVAQKLARHSTITLTMDRYTHHYTDDEINAINKLPNLLAKPENSSDHSNEHAKNLNQIENHTDDLKYVIESWDDLTESIQQGILAMVKAITSSAND